MLHTGTEVQPCQIFFARCPHRYRHFRVTYSSFDHRRGGTHCVANIAQAEGCTRLPTVRSHWCDEWLYGRCRRYEYQTAAPNIWWTWPNIRYANRETRLPREIPIPSAFFRLWVRTSKAQSPTGFFSPGHAQSVLGTIFRQNADLPAFRSQEEVTY